MADSGGSQKPGEVTHHVIATPHSIVFTLTDAHHEQIRACIAKSGKATFTFHEVSVSQLPHTQLGDGVLID